MLPEILRGVSESNRVVDELTEPHVARPAQNAADLAGRMVVVDVLWRCGADRARAALRFDQCCQAVRCQPKGLLQMTKPRQLGPATLAVTRETIGLTRVLVPFSKRFDRVAPSAVLVAARYLHALADFPAIFGADVAYMPSRHATSSTPCSRTA